MSGLPPGIPPAGTAPRMDGVPADRQTPVVPVVEQPVVPVAPVVPVTPEIKTPTVTPLLPADAAQTLGTTGNAVLDLAINAFSKVSGCTDADVSRATATAITHGDVSLIDKAFLRERFGVHADQAIQLAEAAVTEGVKARDVNRNIAYDLAGGQAQWAAAAAAFKANEPSLIISSWLTIVLCSRSQA